MNTTPPAVSVVVPTYQRAASLGPALRSLVAQQTDGAFTFEVIVVDNSAEGDPATRQVVAAVAEKAGVRVQYVHERGSGVARARNRGVLSARGDWIAFCDDDQVADPRWLIRLLEAARATGASCVGGAIALKLPPGMAAATPLVRRLLGEQPFAGAARPCVDKEIPSSGNLLAARRLFGDIGWFDASMALGGEDTEWVRRVRLGGRRVAIAPAAVVIHQIPPHRVTDAYLLWVAERSGSQLAYVDWRHHGRVRVLASCVARLGQGAVRFIPELLTARLRRRDEARLDARLRLRKVYGYARQTARLMSGGTRNAVSLDLDMRTERARFADVHRKGAA